MNGQAELGSRRFPVVFAAPSGAGKTSIARALGERRHDVMFSVSATTRPPRPHERDGVDYVFTSEASFRAMVEAGELLEWAKVHGHLYGTPRRGLEDAMASGRFLILDIDVQGARQVRSAVPDAVSIFVLPPSGTELARRLAGRRTEDSNIQRRRLRAARDEIQVAPEFDYVIVNESLEGSVAAVETILLAESHRPARLTLLDETIARLRAEVDDYLERPAEFRTPSSRE